jgi:adenylate cyclase
LVVLTAILAADATPNGPLANLRNRVFDAYERHSPSSRPPRRTLIIDIDSDSIRHVGQWPWPRDQLARLVERAAGARVIAIDLLLTEPDRLADSDHETDAILAKSLRRVPVVLAAAADPAGTFTPHPPLLAATPVFETGGDPRAALPHFRSVAWPYAVLAGASSGIGFVTVPPEADGIMRRVPTIASVGSLLVPSFAIEIVRVARRADWIGLRTEPNGGRVLEIGDRVIPTDTAAGVWPRYSVNAVGLSLPADRVLDGEIDQDVFRDRVVLIGSSAPGLGDAFKTPLRPLQSGVAIQAQLVDSLLAGDLLRRPSFAPALERLLALVLAIAAMLQFGRMGDKAYTLGHLFSRHFARSVSAHHSDLYRRVAPGAPPGSTCFRGDRRGLGSSYLASSSGASLCTSRGQGAVTPSILSRCRPDRLRSRSDPRGRATAVALGKFSAPDREMQVRTRLAAGGRSHVRTRLC